MSIYGMGIELSEIEDLIEKLNDKYFEQTQDFDNPPFAFETVGCMGRIMFLDRCLWNSVEDYRPCIDEEKDIYESLEVFIRVKTNDILNDLKRFEL